MAAIDDLITQISDKTLRTRLSSEVARITKEKKFGLVFEDHIPEAIPIYEAPITTGSIVAHRGGSLSDTFRVLLVSDEIAECQNVVSRDTKSFSVRELVVVRQFGAPIFPALKPIASIENGDSSVPWHTLIEADNYHALQLLEYIYSRSVDCIYIDPPYNSGARDWKYNNDYVDDVDAWRHSKWLAFMQRRLRIAKRLLKNDGVLIVTVDENEIHHLGCLLEEEFNSSIRQMITIVINPKGTGKHNFARVEEHAIFCMPNINRPSVSGKATTLPDGSEQNTTHIFDSSYSDEIAKEHGWELRHARRRGRESSYRHQRKNQFYPIYINENDKTVVSAGPSLPLDQDPWLEQKDGLRPIWPIDHDGNQRCWRFIPESMQKLIDQERVVLGMHNKKYDTWTLNIWERSPVEKKSKTVWWDSLHDAGTYGTTLLHNILAKRDVFPFPKSVYAVRDCIAKVVKNKPNALILDFFAGSGTTLHAVNLLNAADDGNRQCILVTNNEVSEKEAVSLAKQGFHPGDSEWDEHGICRSVTWPRTSYTILGKRHDGEPLEGDNFLGEVIAENKLRNIQQIDFVTLDDFSTAAKKKRFVALIENLPQSAVGMDTAFIVTEKNSAAILFDDSKGDEWIEALEGQNHITDLYIMTKNKTIYDDLVKRVTDTLGYITILEEETRPMKEGFNANIEYFKLEFLERNNVSLGRQFEELLPLLWLRSGAIGTRPKLPKNAKKQKMLIPDNSNFAILLNESYFAKFAEHVKSRQGITHVFLITDSEESFLEMAKNINAPNLVHLYKDYLMNFMINKDGIR
ncbi:site-specific DNA-methyltransferase [Candidatus Neomarinimicrobiota bacterium]